MDFTHTEESQAADAELNAALDTEANDKQAPQSDKDQRAARIRDLSIESLAKKDSFQACLGASTAGIMQIEQTLQERIIQTLGADSGALTDLTAVMPAVDALLRLERQAERYGQLNLKLQSIDQKTASDKTALQAN